jgi:hypothetical protein
MAWLGMAERGLAWQVWQGAAGSGEERTGLEWHGRRGRVGLGVARRATEWHGRLGLACPGKAGLVKAGKAGHGGERRGWARRGRAVMELKKYRSRVCANRVLRRQRYGVC